MDTRRTELSKASNRTERQYYPEISGRGDRIVSVCSLHDLVARRGARGFLDENRRNSLQKDKELILICTLRVVSLFFPDYRRSDHSAVADSFPEPRGRKHADDLGRCPSNRYLCLPSR